MMSIKRIARAFAVSALFLPTSLAAAPASEQKPVASADLKVEKTIKAKLQRDSDLADDRLHVRAQNGLVVLTGTVDTTEEKAKAARLALVRGTVGVDNRLEVAAETAKRPTADSQLTATIKAKISGSLGSSADDVAVRIADGVVTLSGQVPTQSEHDEAVDVASTTDGVRRVDDQLRIAMPPPLPSP